LKYFSGAAMLHHFLFAVFPDLCDFITEQSEENGYTDNRKNRKDC